MGQEENSHSESYTEKWEQAAPAETQECDVECDSLVFRFSASRSVSEM